MEEVWLQSDDDTDNFDDFELEDDEEDDQTT